MNTKPKSYVYCMVFVLAGFIVGTTGCKEAAQNFVTSIGSGDKSAPKGNGGNSNSPGSGEQEDIADDISDDVSKILGPNGPITAMLPLPSGALILAGDFTNYDGIEVPGLIKIEKNGKVDLTFVKSIGTGFSGAAIKEIVENKDGSISLFGDIPNFNNQYAANIVTLSPSGELIKNLPLQFDRPVDGVTLDADGNLLVFGDFDHASQTNMDSTQSRIALVDNNLNPAPWSVIDELSETVSQVTKDASTVISKIEETASNETPVDLESESSKNIADNIVNDGSNTFGQIREIASDTINKESQTADGVKESQWKEVEETDTSIDLAKDVVENSRNLPGEALTESPQLDASVQKEVKESNLTYDQARQVDNLLSNVRDNIGEVSNGETIPEIANNEISNEDVHKASKDETQQNSPETNQNQEPVRSTNSIRREIASDLVKDDSVHDQCKEPLAELLIVRAEINRKKRKIAGLQGNLKDLREEESKIKKERTQRKQKLQANNKDHRSDRKSLEEDRASNLVQKNKNNNSQSEKKGKKEEKENRFSEREKEKKEKNEHAQSDVHRQISSLQKDIDEKTKKYMTIRRDVKESNCESSYNKKLLQAKKNKGGRS